MGLYVETSFGWTEVRRTFTSGLSIVSLDDGKVEPLIQYLGLVVYKSTGVSECSDLASGARVGEW